MQSKKQLFVRANGHSVPVKEEVYLEYYRSKRRERYFEHDIKTGSVVRDQAGKIIGYKPAKEVSLDRLLESGKEYSDGAESIEDIMVRTDTVNKIRDALSLLAEKDRALIDALFPSNNSVGMTEREYARFTGVSQQSVNERKRRIFGKLKKSLGN